MGRMLGPVARPRKFASAFSCAAESMAFNNFRTFLAQQILKGAISTEDRARPARSSVEIENFNSSRGGLRAPRASSRGENRPLCHTKRLKTPSTLIARKADSRKRPFSNGKSNDLWEGRGSQQMILQNRGRRDISTPQKHGRARRTYALEKLGKRVF